MVKNFKSVRPEDITCESKRERVLYFINHTLPKGEVVESKELVRMLNFVTQDLGILTRVLAPRYVRRSTFTGQLYWGRPEDVAKIE